MSVVLAVGDAFDGVNLIGPFEHCEEACEYADRHHDRETWHVVTLAAPEPSNEGADESEAEQP